MRIRDQTRVGLYKMNVDGLLREERKRSTNVNWARGPGRISHSVRLDAAKTIARELFANHGDIVTAVALYGSVAREVDRPYSDIEMFCIVGGPRLDETIHWIGECGKVELNVLSEDSIRRQASSVDDRWPLVQAKFLDCRILLGNRGMLKELRGLALGHPDTTFMAAISLYVAPKLYEIIGKIRNETFSRPSTKLPVLAFRFVENVALMLGLAYRRGYSNASLMFEESLQLDDLPDGYAELCQLMLRGELFPTEVIVRRSERLWRGIVKWLHVRKLDHTIASRTCLKDAFSRQGRVSVIEGTPVSEAFSR